MKTKRFAALVATGLLSVQVFGVGIAQAASACDFGSDDLEVTIDDTDVALQINNEFLECDDSYNGIGFSSTDSIALTSLDSISVEMDDDQDSDGQFWVLLEDGGNANEPGEWPSLTNFDLDVTTRVNVDASGMEGVTPGVRVVIGAKSISFEGTTVTSNAPSYDVTGSAGRDTIDGSKATVKLVIDGDAGNDLIRGGSQRDDIEGGSGKDVIYAGSGNDITDGGAFSDFDQCWGQDGDDYFTDCVTVGPGAGDDEIDSNGGGSSTANGWASQGVTYADLTAGITFTQWDCAGDIDTGGAAGSDIFDDDVQRLYGTPFDDAMFTACNNSYTSFNGGAGDDRIGINRSTYGLSSYDWSPYYGAFGGPGDDFLSEFNEFGGRDSGNNQQFSGGPGNDVIKAGDGYDLLIGGAGRDTLIGAGGIDRCAQGEVLSSCNYVVSRN